MSYGYSNDRHGRVDASSHSPGRRVVSNDMVRHLWANASQPCARNSKGSVSFSCGELFSYRVAIAYRFTFAPGNVAAFFTRESYSPTTSHHLWAARSAARHLQQYGVENLDSLRHEFAQCERALRDSSFDAKTARARIRKEAAKESRYNTENARALLRVAGVAESKLDSELLRLESANARADKIATNAKKRANDKRRAQILRRFVDSSPQKFRAEIVFAGAAHPDNYAAQVNKLKAIRDEFGDILRDHRRGVNVLSETRLKRLRARNRERLESQKHYESIVARADQNKTTRESLQWLRRQIQALRESPMHAGGRVTSISASVGADRIRAILQRVHAPTSFRANCERLALALDYWAAFESMNEAERERERQRESELRARQQQAERAERFQQWLNGAPNTFRGRNADGEIALRAVDVGRDDSGAIVRGELQTSEGARVPLRHAIRVFQFAKLCRETATPWRRNGARVRVGSFELDSIDSQGNFRVGCHSLTWREIERLARALGVFDLPADAGAAESSHGGVAA